MVERFTQVLWLHLQCHFYQLAVCEARSAWSKIALRFHICWSVCASPLITCTSHALLPCDFTLADLTAALSTGVAISTLA